jgi:membrane protease YdiL (CAAX protease family)
MTIIEEINKKLKTIFPKDLHLHPFWLLVSYLPILGFSALVIIWPIITLLNMIGYPSIPSDQVPVSLADIVRRTIDLGISIIAILVGTWAWRRYLYKRDMTSMGLSFYRPWVSELGIGVFTGVGLTTIIFAVEFLMGWIDVQALVWQVRASSEVLGSLYLAFVTAILAAVVEEILLRGYLLQTLESWIGLPAAVVISSALFGLGHLLSATVGGWENSVIPFTVTLGGLMFASAYLFSRSLWVAIGLHFAWNFCEYNVYALTGTLPDRASILITEVTGPHFWVGLPNSTFGPEVGALGVLAMVFCICMFWWLRSRKQVSAHAIFPIFYTFREQFDSTKHINSTYEVIL